MAHRQYVVEKVVERLNANCTQRESAAWIPWEIHNITFGKQFCDRNSTMCENCKDGLIFHHFFVEISDIISEGFRESAVEK